MALSCEVHKRKFIKLYYGILVTAVFRHTWKECRELRNVILYIYARNLSTQYLKVQFPVQKKLSLHNKANMFLIFMYTPVNSENHSKQ